VNNADKVDFISLYTASQEGHLVVVRELLKYGAGVNTAVIDGDTPLYIAIQKGRVEVVLDLLKYGAGVNTAKKTMLFSVHSKSDRACRGSARVSETWR
jgi:ankyrin repeat protein